MPKGRSPAAYKLEDCNIDRINPGKPLFNIYEKTKDEEDGLTSIHRVCQVANLGGDPEKGEKYRSGTYEYYISEPIRGNDPKAVGPFIFASLEYELK